MAETRQVLAEAVTATPTASKETVDASPEQHTDNASTDVPVSHQPGPAMPTAVSSLEDCTPGQDHPTTDASTHVALVKRIQQLEAELDTVRRKLKLSQKQRCHAIAVNRRMAAGLKKYLNEDQVKCLQRSTMKGTAWGRKTVVKALKIRLSCGARGYNAVKELGQPLPSERTLQRHLEGYKFHPGLLQDIMKSLALKVQRHK
ncbi:uncharacterized protein LOC135379584 [Ornithodoros turicata]|uniref:uncharacterized protein LOC135379584 n=1 Tax=Ornithodoros turicata TaxID=34597 RepID=UPI003138F3EA